jgi:hypothetical protein
VRRALIAAAAAALVGAGSANAEMPNNNGAPEITGRAAVGWGVVGHNGSWLYSDGTACGSECSYSFAWERCRAFFCRPIAGATDRVYKVRAVDVGSQLRVVVSATKYDCGEWNYAAGTRECRLVTRSAVSASTVVVPAPPKKPKKPKKKPVRRR